MGVCKGQQALAATYMWQLNRLSRLFALVQVGVAGVIERCLRPPLPRFMLGRGRTFDF